LHSNYSIQTAFFVLFCHFSTDARTMVPYEFTLFLLCCAAAVESMDVEYSWVYVDYTFSSPSHRDSAIKSGKFIPENCVILDVDVYQGKCILPLHIVVDKYIYVLDIQPEKILLHPRFFCFKCTYSRPYLRAGLRGPEPPPKFLRPWNRDVLTEKKSLWTNIFFEHPSLPEKII